MQVEDIQRLVEGSEARLNWRPPPSALSPIHLRNVQAIYGVHYWPGTCAAVLRFCKIERLLRRSGLAFDLVFGPAHMQDTSMQPPQQQSRWISAAGGARPGSWQCGADSGWGCRGEGGRAKGVAGPEPSGSHPRHHVPPAAEGPGVVRALQLLLRLFAGTGTG